MNGNARRLCAAVDLWVGLADLEGFRVKTRDCARVYIEWILCKCAVVVVRAGEQGVRKLV